jgi:hypothetical protein
MSRTRLVPLLLALLLLAVLSPGCTDEGDDGGGGRGDPPRARIRSSVGIADEGEPITFDGRLSNGTDLSYGWDMGDGTRGKGPEVEHTFGIPGAYTVTLTVEDRWGQTDQDSVIIKVNYHKVSEGTLDPANGEHSETIPVQENAGGFRLTLTYPSGTTVGGQPSNDLDLIVYYPNGTEAWSTSGDEPDAGQYQVEELEVPQQMLAEVFWDDWDLVVRRVLGLSVAFELDVLVTY